MAEKEFRVNKHIVLKLEQDKTNIYIANKLFRQCKSLFFANPQENEHQSEINSIDEAMELLSTSSDIEIPPEEEFWGHCSNIQTWAENDYNTQILDMRLAFPILNELSNLGDKKARFKFSEEIFRRYDEGGENIRDYLISEGYLDKTVDNPIFHLLCAEEAGLILELQMNYNVIFKVDTFTPRARYRKDWTAVVKDRCISSLALNYDEIKSCPDLRKLKNLQYAGIQVKDAEIIDLKYFPESIRRITIYLEGNADSLTINNISNLKNLRRFSVRNKNKEKKIDLTLNGIELNTNLNAFFLQYCHVRALGDNKLMNLKKLVNFGITHCMIKEIPVGIWKNEHVTTVDLKGAKIKTPVQDITQMKSLKYICLGNLTLPPANHLQDFRKRNENSYISKDFSIMDIPI